MLKIFNTLTKKKEIFKTIYKKKIFMYVCGVTVYDSCHIGHARTFLFFDMIVRYFKILGYSVKYARNITDIDDKIIKKSLLNNQNWKDFVNLMITKMNQDFKKLDLMSPTFEPRVTKFIKEIIYFIKKLIKLGFAYIHKNGDVLFSIKNYKKYGELSNLSVLHSNKKIKKKNILFLKKDFVLWKINNKYKEPFWASPWGNGRPGWHIECSAINHKIFKSKLDIHGGGNDLIFPHHENERAQSESLCLKNKKYSNYWIHTGMIIVNKNKMSKSLNNSLYISDLLKKYHPEVIKYYFLSTNYKHPIFFSFKNLKNSELKLKKLYLSLLFLDLKFKDNILKKDLLIQKSKYFKLFYKFMNNDFDTYNCLLILMNLSKKINILRSFSKINKSKIKKYSFILLRLGKILGFFTCSPKKFLKCNLKKFYSTKKILLIKNLVYKRNIFRKLKMWKKSDKIRKNLLNLGIKIEDHLHKTIIMKK
ncbi:cysteine--tRNA ligase [Buchnera aphidicola]|uniref:cysteine--tRNA ligase n=1 Tax=Buchnera aphidicola TaxID=9 RepID=UPI003463FF84